MPSWRRRPLQQKAWSASSAGQKRARLKQFVDRVVISRHSVEIKVTDEGRETLAEADFGSLRIETMLKASAGGKQIVSQYTLTARIDRSLVKAIVSARGLAAATGARRRIAGRPGSAGKLFAALRQQHDQAGIPRAQHHPGHSRRDPTRFAD